MASDDGGVRHRADPVGHPGRHRSAVGSFPTLGRLVTIDPENVVGTPQLEQIRNQVAATGRLPDQGVLITVTIPPTVSHFSTRPAYVYLPPAWFAKVTPSLPTLDPAARRAGKRLGLVE